MFILTAHLKGYKRKNIDIDINKDGSQITISGKKPIQEMMMMGWVMFKKEVGIAGFKKVFRIPDGVILDRIKAKYDEDESILNIVMPKLRKGIRGVEIEEVKEEELDREKLEPGQCEADHIPNSIGETSQAASKESEVRETVESGNVGKKEGEECEKMLAGDNGAIVRETVQKEIEENKFKTEDRDEESVREEVGKEGFEAMKMPELEQNLADYNSNNIGETSQEVSEKSVIQTMEETESNVQDMEGGEQEKSNGVIEEDRIGERNQEMEEAESVREKMDTEESRRMHAEINKVVQKNIEESIQKDIEEPKIETEDGKEDSVREIGKEGFEALEPIVKEFPKQKTETAVEENAGLKVAKSEETDVTREARVQKNGKEIKPFGEEEEGGKSRKIYDEARRVIEKDINKEMIKKETEKHKIETKDGNEQILQDGIVKGGLEASTSIIEEFPKKQGELTMDGSKGSEVVKMEETKEAKEAVKMVEGEKSKKISEEKKRIVEKGILREKTQKDIEEFNTKTKAEGGKDVPESIVKGASAVSGNQVVEATTREGKGPNGMHVEEKEVSDKGMVGDRIQMETRVPKIELENKDQFSGKRNDDSRGYHVMETLGKEFPKQVAGVLLDVSTGVKVEKRTVTKDIDEESAETKDSMEQGKAEKHEKQVEASGGFGKDISTETTQAEMGEPKIETKDRDQQCVHEEMSKERFEASRTAKRELPMRIAGSQINEGEEPKDTNIIEMNEVKEEVLKRKSAETKVVADDESSIKQKVSESESDRMYKTKEITETLQEVTEAKHPKSLETGIPERKVQPTKDIASSPKVESAEFKDVDQGSAYDMPRKKELPTAKAECMKGKKSEKGTVKQDSLKEKGAKEIEEEDQCTQSLKSKEPFGIVADQIAKPLQLPSLPSTQQSEVEGKEKKIEALSQEITKRDLETDIKDSDKMKESQEARRIETLQPDIPLKESLKKEEVAAQEQILGEPKVENTVQEENEKSEGPKIAEGEEAKEASEQSIRGERGKMTQITEGEKPEIKEITPEFEGAEICEVNQPAAMQETAEREYHRESAEVTPKGRFVPPKTLDTLSKAASKEYEGIKPTKETENSQTEELSPPIEIHSKEPHDLSKPSMEQKGAEVEGEQREKEAEKHIDALAGNELPEALTPKGEVAAPNSRAPHSKFEKVEPKDEIDNQQTKELPPPSADMLSRKPYDLAESGIKQDDSRAEIAPQVREGKEPIHFLESTKSSEAVADEMAKPSQLLSPTQQLQVEEKGKTDQESEKQEFEQIEASLPEPSPDQPFINYNQEVIGQEETQGGHPIQQETDHEQRNEVNVHSSRKDPTVEASGEKKDDTKGSKKLCCPLIVTGSAIIFYLIVSFLRHRRARKR